MAKKKVLHILHNNTVSQDILDVVMDAGIRSRYLSLKDYLSKHHFEYSEDEFEKLIQDAEGLVYEEVNYLAHLMYHIMNLSDDWGDAGRQQVMVAFCRNLLKTPANDKLTFEDVITFNERVDYTLEKLNIKNVPLDQAKTHYKSYFFSIFGHRFELNQADQINNILHFLGSSLWLHGRNQGEWPSFILGEGKAIHKAEYEIVFLTEELIRTPNIIMAMAAIVGGRDIFVREESLEIIFYQKWMHMFAHPDEVMEKCKTNEYKNIASAIKAQCLSLYGVSTAEELVSKKKTFLKDMRETIYYHEIGHGLVQHYLLPHENVAIGEGTQFFGETIFTSMSEFLADFSPKHKSLKGPIQNIIEISKKDCQRAERMYYMYFSDTFFLDTQDEYMYLYSDLMCVILLKYIKEDKHVDFDKLEHDLTFRKGTDHPDPTIFERLFDLYLEDTEQIRKIAYGTTFVLDKGSDFNYVKGLCVSKARQLNPAVNVESYEFLAPFWLNMMSYIVKLSQSKEKLSRYVEKQKFTVLKKILVAATGRKTAENYKYDLRKYFTDKMKSLGFLAYK